MLRKGIVDQQIEALGRALAKFAGLREKGDAAEAQKALQNACRELTGLDWNLAQSFSADSLLSLLRTPQGLDAGRCANIAVLLQEQGRLDEEAGQRVAAKGRYQKSLRLLTEALTQEKRLWTPDFTARLHDLTARIGAL